MCLTAPKFLLCLTLYCLLAYLLACLLEGSRNKKFNLGVTVISQGRLINWPLLPHPFTIQYGGNWRVNVISK